MIKQLIINGAVNTWLLSNRPHGYITFQYNTANQTLQLIDTQTGITTNIISKGKIAINSDVTNKITEIQNSLNALIAGAFRFQGVKETIQELQNVTNPKIGDVWQVRQGNNGNTDCEYAWNGTEWIELGSIIDLNDFYTKGQINQLISGFATIEYVNQQDTILSTNIINYVNQSLSTTVDQQISAIIKKINQI